ncbi:hypothetical protein [Novosphingobium sp.]|uniref:hypothetical protein n=1 Tax=Novosphingobium sp. TaxID=1874826 RepID=UPI0025E1D3DD|nr:hypothetical protein [Novosphingobium sp.]
MVRKSHSIRKHMLCAASLIGLVVAQQAAAQEAPQEQPDDAAKSSEIVVTGSRIAGSKITEALPVTVVSEDDIAATAAVSGDDLIARSRR